MGKNRPTSAPMCDLRNQLGDHLLVIRTNYILFIYSLLNITQYLHGLKQKYLDHYWFNLFTYKIKTLYVDKKKETFL